MGAYTSQGKSDADTDKVIYVKTSDIKFWIEKRYPEELKGHVLSGDWDLNKRTRENVLKNSVKYKGMKQHFLKGVPWEETCLFTKKYHPDIERGASVRNKENISDLIELYRKYDGLWANVKENGLMTKASSIYVHIGREGEIIYTFDGNHRYYMALLLGIKQIPVKVWFRHEGWEKIRRNYHTYPRLSEHPDLQEFKKNILQMSVSTPTNAKPASATYIVDMVNILDAQPYMNCGLLHVNSCSSARENLLNKKRLINTKGIYYDKIYPKAIDKRNSVIWVNDMMDGLERYIQQYGMPDIVHCHSGRGAGEVGLKIKAKYGIPFVVQEHHSAFLRARVPDAKRLSNVYSHAKHVCSVSDKMKGMHKIAPKGKVRTVPNLINGVFEESVIRDLDMPFKIVMVGRLDSNKSVHVGVKAFALLRGKIDAELHIIGCGPREGSIRNLISKLGVEGITMHGYLPKRKIANILTGASVLLVCSNNETFGVPAVEALMCGCRVISTANGGAEYIAEQVEGISLVDKKVNVISEAILSAIKNPLSTDGRQAIKTRAVEIFGREKTCQLWEEIYA